MSADEPRSDDKKPEPPRTSRRAILLALAGGLVGGGGGGFAAGYFVGRPKAAPRKPVSPAHVRIEAWNPRLGPDPAKVTLVEFVDLQCPFCERHAATMVKLREKFGDAVAVVLKHRPLPFHKDAKGAAIALQAAHRQGKSGQLHDLMFENRKQLPRELLLELAGKAGLDVAKFTAHLDDPEIAKEVESDDALAVELSVSGTPYTFVNGVGVRGARPYEAFEPLVQEEIAAADALLASGTSLADVYRLRSEANVAAGPRLV